MRSPNGLFFPQTYQAHSTRTPMSTPLAILLQNKFIVSLAVALIVSVYAWNAIPPQDPNTGEPNVSRGGVALRLFFVTFLSIYLLSYLLENFEKGSIKVGGGGSVGSVGGGASTHNNNEFPPSLKAALKQVDRSIPDF
jgi:hypothetical protein